jgi:hypothetical protein
MVMAEYKKLENMISTIGKNRIATSFTKNEENYFVSTVKGINGDNKYQSIIKQAFTHPNSFFCFLTTTSCINAAMNHIALVAMADALNKSEWNESAAKSFLPSQQKKEVDNFVSGEIDVKSFNDSYIKSLLTISNLNIKKKSKFSYIVWVCIILFIYYFFLN